MEENKKAIPLICEETLDIIAIIMVDEGADIRDISQAIKKTKEEIPGWQVSDVINNIPMKYKEVRFDVIYC